MVCQFAQNVTPINCRTFHTTLASYAINGSGLCGKVKRISKLHSEGCLMATAVERITIKVLANKWNKKRIGHSPERCTARAIWSSTKIEILYCIAQCLH